MIKINKLLRESIKQVLNEKMSEGSYEISPYFAKLESLGFHIDENGDSEVDLWRQMTNPEDEKRAYDYVEELASRCGWSIIQCGGFYDGLRSQAENIAKRNDISKYSVYIFVLQKDYGTDAGDDFETVKNENFWEETPEKAEMFNQNILWHNTYRKYLRRIFKNGLMPKNGDSLTGWRNTKDRVYLSLLPDMRECSNDETEDLDGDDMILLKIDISNLKDKVKFYVDEDYEDAVYTYSIIPPSNISVVDKNDFIYMRAYNVMNKDLDYFIQIVLKSNKNYTAEDLYKYNKSYFVGAISNLSERARLETNLKHSDRVKIITTLLDKKFGNR